MSLIGSLSKYLQQLELVQAESGARNSIQVTPLGSRGLSALLSSTALLGTLAGCWIRSGTTKAQNCKN